MLLDLIRQAARHVGDRPLTLRALELWAAEREIVTPAEVTWASRFGSWSGACQAAGAPCGAGRSDPKVVKERAIEVCVDALTEFVAVCEQLGREPRQSLYEGMSSERGWPSRKTICKRLAPAWSDVLAMAGAQPADDQQGPDPGTEPNTEVPVSKQQCDDAVDEFLATAPKATTTRHRYEQWRHSRNQPTAAQIRVHYDSWQAVIDAGAGRASNQIRIAAAHPTRQRAISSIRSFLAEHPDEATLVDYRTWVRKEAGRAPLEEVMLFAASWEQAKAGNFDQAPDQHREWDSYHPPVIGHEELLESVRAFVAETPGPHESSEFRAWLDQKRWGFCDRTVVTCVGLEGDTPSLHVAIQRAGVADEAISRADLTRQTTVEAIERFHAETGSTNKRAFIVWCQHNNVPVTDYSLRSIGGWDNLCAAVVTDYEPTRSQSDLTGRGTLVRDDDIEQALQSAAATLGLPLRQKTYQSWASATGAPSPESIRKRHGPWREALETFGLAVDRRPEAIRFLRRIGFRDPNMPLKGKAADQTPNPHQLTRHIVSRLLVRGSAPVSEVKGVARSSLLAWDESELADALRCATSATHGPLTKSSYRTWATTMGAKGNPIPTVTDLIAHFGSWEKVTEHTEFS